MALHSFGVFQNYERSRWIMGELPWDKLDPARVTDRDVMLVRSALMGECNSIAAVHGFMNEFIDDYDFSAFVSVWGYEELQHHFVFRAWLERAGRPVDDLPVEATRAPYPPGVAPAATLMTNVISELTVNYAYMIMAKMTDEPVLQQIATNLSRDEARHAREFIHYTGRRLERHPAERQAVLETLYVYLADPREAVKHPVGVFKGALSELKNTETIADGLAAFARESPEAVERLQSKIYHTSSSILGIKIESATDVKRELRRVMHGADRTV